MTEEDEARVVGLAVLRRQKAARRLEMLKAEADRLGNLLNNLATRLIASPEDIWFEGTATTALERWEANRSLGKFKSTDFDIARIAELGIEIRAAKEELEAAHEAAKKLGQ